MIGDPIGLSETDYFTHSQYEGIGRDVRREAVERLYKYHQPYVNQIMKDSPYYLIKRWLDLDEGVGQQLCESHLDVGTFQQRRESLSTKRLLGRRVVNAPISSARNGRFYIHFI